MYANEFNKVNYLIITDNGKYETCVNGTGQYFLVDIEEGCIIYGPANTLDQLLKIIKNDYKENILNISQATYCKTIR